MESSRTRAAGWDAKRDAYVDLGGLANPWMRHATWKSALTLIRARNEKITPRLFADPTPAQRQAWLAAMEALGRPADRVIARGDVGEAFPFVVVGDPGEGDYSQLVTLAPLRVCAEDTAFMVIVSDVIYPAGNVNAYPELFYEMYDWYPERIYAVPGNHDWDDGGLFGFMYHFCGAETVPDAVRKAVPWWARRVLFKLPRRPTRRTRAKRANRYVTEARRPEQPGPYWAIDTPSLRIVGIDTGLGDYLDAMQGAWLRDVSASRQPKILITGKPLYVNGQPRPCPVLGGTDSVDAIVRTSEYGYIAAIGGDVHNYQRYPLRTSDGRIGLVYLVSGGGGAYGEGTHALPEMSNESEIRLYPRRGDSLAAFSYLYVQRAVTLVGSLLLLAALLYVAVRAGVEQGVTARAIVIAGLVSAAGIALRAAAKPIARSLGLPPTVAETIIERRFDIPRTRTPEAGARTEPRRRDRLLAWFVIRGAELAKGLYSPFWDWDTLPPPFSKSFLRVEVAPGEVRIRCFAATGRQADVAAPPVEDDLRWTAERGWELPNDDA